MSIMLALLFEFHCRGRHDGGHLLFIWGELFLGHSDPEHDGGAPFSSYRRAEHAVVPIFFLEPAMMTS
jgi:hypothetical protein